MIMSPSMFMTMSRRMRRDMNPEMLVIMVLDIAATIAKTTRPTRLSFVARDSAVLFFQDKIQQRLKTPLPMPFIIFWPAWSRPCSTA